MSQAGGYVTAWSKTAMSDRFAAYLTMLAGRDTALVALAAMAAAALVPFLCAPVVIPTRGQRQLLLVAGIVYHLTLLYIILGGKS